MHHVYSSLWSLCWTPIDLGSNVFVILFEGKKRSNEQNVLYRLDPSNWCRSEEVLLSSYSFHHKLAYQEVKVLTTPRLQHKQSTLCSQWKLVIRPTNESHNKFSITLSMGATLPEVGLAQVGWHQLGTEILTRPQMSCWCWRFPDELYGCIVVGVGVSGSCLCWWTKQQSRFPEPLWKTQEVPERRHVRTYLNCSHWRSFNRINKLLKFLKRNTWIYCFL